MSFSPGGGSGSGALSGDSDVALSNPATDHVLAYDGTTAKWINKPVPAAGAFVLSRPGALTVAGGSARLPLPFDCTLVGVAAAIGETADDAVLVDINCNGTSIFADANDRPSITASSYQSAESVIAASVTAGDYLTVDVDQVGSTAPGADLTVVIRYQ